MRVAGLVVAALLLAACSGSEEEDGAAPPSPSTTAGPTSTVAASPATTTNAATTATTAAAGAAWETRAPLLEANSETAVAESNGRIYVIGGYPFTRVVAATVQVYDIAADTWSRTTPLPVPLHHTMAAAVNGKVYVLGGGLAGPGGTAGSQSVDTVYEFDPATSAWARRSPMPTAREGGVTAVLDGKIYVAGGRPPRGADFAVYDPAADRWTSLPNLPTQRNHLAAAAISGKVYVVGGRFGGGVGSEMTAVVEAFDPRTNTWERKAPMPTVRAGINGVAARGCLYVFGGEGNDGDPRGVFAEMESYNPATDRWTSLPSLPTPVHGVTGSAFVNGWIHLPGGGTARGGNSGSTLHQVFRAPQSCA